jgi:hypothetical protein
LRIALPPFPSLSWPSSPWVKYILAKIIDPKPALEYQVATDTEGQHDEILDEEDHFLRMDVWEENRAGFETGIGTSVPITIACFGRSSRFRCGT